MIRATAIVQILGKPKEHIEKVVKDIADTIPEQGYTVERTELMPVEPAEGEDEEGLYSGLFEVDLKLDDHEELFAFIQDYNPTSLEVSEPDEFTMRLPDYNGLVTSVVTIVQQYDQLLKEKIAENIAISKRADRLIRNLITLSIAIKPKGHESIKLETGLAEQVLDPYLKAMVKDGTLEQNGIVYSIAKTKAKKAEPA